MPCLLYRVDLLAIDENSERSRSAGTHSNRNTKFTFDVVLETHGLAFQVTSKEAAFNLDNHAIRPQTQNSDPSLHVTEPP